MPNQPTIAACPFCGPQEIETNQPYIDTPRHSYTAFVCPLCSTSMRCELWNAWTAERDKLKASNEVLRGAAADMANQLMESQSRLTAAVEALRALTPLHASEGDWWCPECQDYINCATNHECCPCCGTYLTDVQPSGEWHKKALAVLAQYPEKP